MPESMNNCKVTGLCSFPKGLLPFDPVGRVVQVTGPGPVSLRPAPRVLEITFTSARSVLAVSGALASQAPSTEASAQGQLITWVDSCPPEKPLQGEILQM